MYSYILLSSLPYEGPWILGIVNSLEEASEYFLKKLKKETYPTKKSPEELVQRALDDNWEDSYFSYWVAVWDKTQRICTYKYNVRTNLLEKQKPRFGELEYKSEFNDSDEFNVSDESNK